MRLDTVCVSLSPPRGARDDAPVAACRVNQLDQVEDGVGKLPVAPRLGLERGPGQLTERSRPKHRHSVNPGNGVREDGGGQTPELSDRDIKAACFLVMSLLTMILIFMSVATGGLVRTEEGQKHGVCSGVLCLSRAPDTKTFARVS